MTRWSLEYTLSAPSRPRDDSVATLPQIFTNQGKRRQLPVTLSPLRFSRLLISPPTLPLPSLPAAPPLFPRSPLRSTKHSSRYRFLKEIPPFRKHYLPSLERKSLSSSVCESTFAIWYSRNSNGSCGRVYKAVELATSSLLYSFLPSANLVLTPTTTSSSLLRDLLSDPTTTYFLPPNADILHKAFQLTYSQSPGVAISLFT